MPGRGRVLLAAVLLWMLVAPSPASSQYFRQRESNIDPKIFHIDDKTFLGVKLDPALKLKDGTGREFTLKEMLETPLILVFSYYRCDGSCSAVNSALKALLEEPGRMAMGQGFRVLTLSFDEHDDAVTLGKFATDLDLPEEWKEKWTLALFADPGDIKRVTGRVGFKFFWSAPDMTFFHPNVLIFLSPDGRVARYLNAMSNDRQDLDMAILEARKSQFEPHEIVDYVASLCFSYSFKDGRYVYNIPLFVGAGSLLLGILLLVGSLVIFKKKKVTTREEA
ncbi:MAG: SCO family protein [Magnetococcales bacterium]|nr:SCO family protein [Magnetococcales bacterium]MBF0156557.1 SCO family protein [Magnetococcales bacterium]